MPTVREHLVQAERNELFANMAATLSQRFPEWEITAFFYSALHYASAFLASMGHDPENHQRRNTLIAELSSFGSDYQNLYRLSLSARYRMIPFTSERVEEIRDGPFHRVKNEVLELLGGHQ